MNKIVICHFGITRSLKHTIASIRRNVSEPARARAHVTVCCHFFEQKSARATSGKLEGPVDIQDARLLAPDWLETEAPGACLEAWNFSEICSYGDHWNNNFASLRNLVHQLHSLDRVTDKALTENADAVIFCRPDLQYHDSLLPVIDEALDRTGQRECVFLPEWQSWGGHNDRFAIAVGSRAVAAYGQRLRQALPYCQDTGKALHAEQLLRHVLDRADIDVVKITPRASRVRASGRKVWESFGDERANQRHERFKSRLWTLLDRSGLKPFARRIVHLFRSPE